MEETIGYGALFSTDEWANFECAEWEGPDPDGPHKVTVWYPPGEFAGNEQRHELECDTCGHIGAADSLDEAQAMQDGRQASWRSAPTAARAGASMRSVSARATASEPSGSAAPAPTGPRCEHEKGGLAYAASVSFVVGNLSLIHI